MKYQQLENLECGWKWSYLIKKWKEGEAITRHIDSSEADVAVKELLKLEHQPTGVLDWIAKHMSFELDNKLKQAIRAKRKRHFNAEQVHTKKKSIDLDYRVWEKLSQRANELGCTLSDAIEYLVSEASRSEQASKTVNNIKEDLSKLLSDDK
ncbi:MAG: macrodomain Ter protein MatP [Vibrio gallaecicus]